MKGKQNKKRSERTKVANKKPHLTYEERVKIEGFIKEGFSYKRIADNLKREKSTIYEEIKRNKGWLGYSAKKAHARALFRQYRKKRGCNKVAMSIFLKRFVERSLRLGWSPERIASRLHFLHEKYSSMEVTSGKSIRKYIRKRSGLERFLWSHRMKRKSGPKRGTWLQDTTRRFIDSMPEIKGFGTFEVDFIVSSKGTTVLLVLVDVVTKLVRMRVLPRRVNTEVNTAIAELLAPYPEAHTLVPDNDIAFAKWKELAIRIGAFIYFARPYKSTDKPLVENTNKWIREFIPKKTDLASISPEQIIAIEKWFNHTPRECLGGMTAFEMYEREMGRDTIAETYPRHPILSPLSAMPFVFGGRGASPDQDII